MPKVVWSADNDRKLLIRLIDRSAKSYDSAKLAQLFPGATPKAIEERIAKLKREAKALDGPKSLKSSKIAPSPTSPSATPRKGKRKLVGVDSNMDQEDDPEPKPRRNVKREKHGNEDDKDE